MTTDLGGLAAAGSGGRESSSKQAYHFLEVSFDFCIQIQIVTFYSHIFVTEVTLCPGFSSILTVSGKNNFSV